MAATTYSSDESASTISGLGFYASRKTVAYSTTPTNLQQHLHNEHPVEFADIVMSEEQKKNPKQSSIKDFTHCSPGSLALQYPKGKACELLKKIVPLRCCLTALCRVWVFKGWLNTLHQGIKFRQGCIFQGQECPSCTKMWSQKSLRNCHLPSLLVSKLVVNCDRVWHHTDGSFHNIWAEELHSGHTKHGILVCTLKSVWCNCF